MTTTARNVTILSALVIVALAVGMWYFQLGRQHVAETSPMPIDSVTEVGKTPRDTSAHVVKPPRPPTKIKTYQYESPPGKQPLTAAADEAVRKMANASIAFNIPDSVMTVGETSGIQLLIDLRQTEGQLRSAVALPGDVQTHTIKVSSTLEAKLYGDGFDVQALTPETQPLTVEEPTEWRWSITAASAGENQLHLVINALVELEGEKMQRAIKTFDEEITVRVSFGTLVADFIGKYWQWLMATIVIPLVVYFWKSRKKRTGTS